MLKIHYPYAFLHFNHDFFPLITSQEHFILPDHQHLKHHTIIVNSLYVDPELKHHSCSSPRKITIVYLSKIFIKLYLIYQLYG